MAGVTWRQRIGAFIGGFDAGQHHRRLRGFRATRAHVNALIAASGPDITARARWLVRNNGYAVNAVESWAANTVGEGIKPISKIGEPARKEELQRLWLDWTDTADAEGLTDFYGLQRRAAREVFIAGEVFVRIRTRRAVDGLTVPLQLQLLPAEMLPLEHSGSAATGNAIRQGIEFDRIGRRVAYHFLRRHPGDSTDPGLAGEVVRVPAAEVIHVIDPVEGGQLRGVSKLAPAIVKLFLLDQYDDAELDRKKVAAMYAMFVTSPAPENPLAPPDDEDGMGGLEISPGQVVRLDPGEDVTVGQPADSGATYEPFQYRTLLQISAALGMSRIDSATLRQATADVLAFGVVVSEQDAEQIERTNDAISRLGLVWRGLSNQLAVAAAPALEAVAEAMASVARTTGPLGLAIRGLLDNISRLASIAGTFAAFMAGRWVAGLAAAALSVRGLATALVLLRGALIRTGIGALIVGAGELVFQFGKLVSGDRAIQARISDAMASGFSEQEAKTLSVWVAARHARDIGA